MAKKLKRMSRKELRQTDEVMTRLQQIYGWLSLYRWHLTFGAMTLVGVLLVTSFVVTWSAERSRGIGTGFAEAVGVLGAPVMESDGFDLGELREQLAGGRAFETRQEKYDRAVEKLRDFLGANSRARVAPVARLSLAAAMLEIGATQEAQNEYEAFLEGRHDKRWALLARERLGIAALDDNDIDTAVSWFEGLVESKVPYFVAVARGHLGDLFNPSIPGASSRRPDAGKARAEYEEGIAALSFDERRMTSGEQTLKEELERRIALLGVAP